MTTDEVLQRHGLTRDDVIFRDKTEMLDRETSECEYAIVTDGYMEWWTLSDMKYYNIIGYYPDPGVYLVKRRAPDAMQITATMDYHVVEDSDGNIGGAEYRNFKLECE